MKKSTLFILLITFSPFIFAGPQYSAQIQASYAPPSGSIVGLQLEGQFNFLPESMTLAFRYGYMEYYIEDGDYWEEGWGDLYSLGVRYYTGGVAMQQWFIAGEIAKFDVTVDWGGYRYYGANWSEGFVPVFSAGYRKNFSTFFIEPNAMLAAIGLVDSEADSPVILTIGLGIGKAF